MKNLELFRALLVDFKRYDAKYQELLKQNLATAEQTAYYNNLVVATPLVKQAITLLDNSATKSEENKPKSKLDLEKRFRELLDKANTALLEKGLAAITLPPDDSFIA